MGKINNVVKNSNMNSSTTGGEKPATKQNEAGTKDHSNLLKFTYNQSLPFVCFLSFSGCKWKHEGDWKKYKETCKNFKFLRLFFPAFNKNRWTVK